jgi:hypothetical protein
MAERVEYQHLVLSGWVQNLQAGKFERVSKKLNFEEIDQIVGKCMEDENTKRVGLSAEQVSDWIMCSEFLRSSDDKLLYNNYFLALKEKTKEMLDKDIQTSQTLIDLLELLESLYPT